MAVDLSMQSIRAVARSNVMNASLVSADGVEYLFPVAT
jgi:hypothetical protein